VRGALGDEGSIGLIAADADLDRIGRSLTKAGIPATRLDAEEPAGSSDEATESAADAVAVAAEAAAPQSGRLILVPATLAKGLEYDQVIVVEPGAIADAEHDALLGLRRLYVVLTRAVTRLTVLHARPLPAELAV
jgi:sirohydrochlorin ferrochelatase